MNDFRDLKAIAEACQQHRPLRFMRSHGALYIRNDNGIVFDVHQNRSFPEFMAQNKDYADLVIAANPATILAMFAEIERLQRAEKNDLIAYKAVLERQHELREERDQLRAEVAGLKIGYQAYERVNAELKAEVEGLRKRADRWEEVGRLILSEMPLRLRPSVAGNAPGHCHDVPGVWDQGNGDLAGRECAWCKVWATALELSKGPAHE